MRKCFYGYSQNTTGLSYCPKSTLCTAKSTLPFPSHWLSVVTMKRQRAAEKLRRRKHWYVICQLYCEINWDSGIPSYRSNTQSLATSHKIFLSDKMEFFLKIGFSPLQILMLKEQGGKYKLSWQCVAGIACGAIFSGGGDLLCAETKVDSVQRQQHTLPRFDPGGWKKTV